MHRTHLLPLTEELGHSKRVSLMLLHSNRKGSQAAKEQPRVERVENSAKKEERAIEDLLDQRCGRDHCAGNDVAVSADVLGCGMHHDIDAVQKSLLKER